jgi:hypothetical protein
MINCAFIMLYFRYACLKTICTTLLTTAWFSQKLMMRRTLSHQITHQSLTQVCVTCSIKQPTHIFHTKDTDLDPVFKIENLKCRTTLAEEALEQIKNDGIYDFSPLPATDVNEKLIPPSKYEEMLLGATILLRFILSSDIISSKMLQFYADIELITVLQKP